VVEGSYSSLKRRDFGTKKLETVRTGLRDLQIAGIVKAKRENNAKSKRNRGENMPEQDFGIHEKKALHSGLFV